MSTLLPRDAHACLLARLLEDGATPAAIREAAQLTGRSPRTIRRWIARGTVPDNAQRRYETTEADLEAVVQCCGHLRKAYELRLQDTAVLPSRRSWERAVHRAMPPDQLELARNGDRGARAHTTYLSWEP